MVFFNEGFPKWKSCICIFVKMIFNLELKCKLYFQFLVSKHCIFASKRSLEINKKDTNEVQTQSKRLVKIIEKMNNNDLTIGKTFK